MVGTFFPGLARPQPAPPSGFAGNPNIVVSGTPAGSILLSRPSGSLPAFVHASASGITATGTSWPYEDLWYAWNFGDPASAETFTDPTTGFTVNSNSDQTGPEAVHVYRSVGTYTITLTIYWRDSGGSVQSTTKTATFTANAFVPSFEYFIDPVNGSDGNAGTNSGAPWQTFAPVRAGDLNGKALNLKRGTTIDDHLGRQQSRTTVRIRPYGTPTDPDPIINYSGSANSGQAIWLDTGTSTNPYPITDWVVSNIHWKVSGAATAPFIMAVVTTTPSAYVQDFYMDNCHFTANPAHTVNVCQLNPHTNGVTNDRGGFWKCSTHGVTGSLDGTQRQGIAAQGWRDWFFVVGGSHEGNGQDNIRDHHIYPIFKTHGLFRWINFGVGTNKNMCVNTDWNSTSTAVTCTAGTIDDGSGTGSPAGSVFTPAGTVVGTFAVGQSLYYSGGAQNGYLIAADLGGGKFTIKLIDTGANVSLALTARAFSAYDRQYSEYILFANNYFYGTKYAFDANDANNNYAAVQWRNVICQFCDFNLSDGGPFSYSLISMTVRYCESWGASQFGWWNPGNLGYVLLDQLAYKFYYNNIYLTAGDFFLVIPGSSNPITSTKPLTFTDNKLHSTRTAATFINMKATDIGANSLLDRNTYYAPNDTDGKVFVNGGTAETLATWKAHGANFDPNSVSTDPGFNNPGAGDFT